MKSYGTYVLLAIFLGGFGLHKFYVNKPALGLLYLLTCWTFVPAIVSLCEGLLSIMLGKGHFDRKYNKPIKLSTNSTQS